MNNSFILHDFIFHLFMHGITTECQIKSNHFYCHITTAQVPWWVKFLWACSRQCRKTTDNLHMDRQCKKTTNNLPMDRQCKKTTNNLPMDRQCKKTTNNLHMDRQCKKTALEHLQCSRQCKKKKTTTTIYIWTDSAKKKKTQQFTYGQTVQKTTAIYIWTVHISMLRMLRKPWKLSAWIQTIYIYLWFQHGPSNVSTWQVVYHLYLLLVTRNYSISNTTWKAYIILQKY